MKKRISGLLLTCIIIWFGHAAALSIAPPLEGTVLWPEDSDASTAQFIYRYSYPQLAGEDDIALSVNGFYQYQLEDALAFLVPMEAENHQQRGTSGVIEVSCDIMLEDASYLSILTVTRRTVNHAAERSVYTAQTFALTGDKAGQVITLPYLLDVLDAKETDEWLLDRQVKKANQIVRSLVWEALQQTEGGVPESWTMDQLEARFFPEEDFYLNEAGQIVFYLQPTAESPWITIPLTRESILDEW